MLRNGYQDIREVVKYLKDKRVIIPGYQRGYRWGETQIKEFLEDVFDNYSKEEADMSAYCLQPLVIKEDGDKGKEVHVIDGQQRLTTLKLVIKTLNNIYDAGLDEYKLEYPQKVNNYAMCEV